MRGAFGCGGVVHTEKQVLPVRDRCRCRNPNRVPGQPIKITIRITITIWRELFIVVFIVILIE